MKSNETTQAANDSRFMESSFSRPMNGGKKRKLTFKEMQERGMKLMAAAKGGAK